MSDDIPPQWAMDKARTVLRVNGATYDLQTIQVFATYIAEHEQPPVDPLLAEAREVAAQKRDYSGWCGARSVRDGFSDEADDVQLALAALKRGMELAGQR